MAYSRATKKQIDLFLSLSVEMGTLLESSVETERIKLARRSYADLDRAIRRLNAHRKFDRQLSPPSEKQLAFLTDLEIATKEFSNHSELTWVQADLRIKRLQALREEMRKPSAPVIDIFTKRRVS